ncbi:hydroxysteroid dehydrogenase-like protein 2 [Anthonomus grandis grandis]|uniref:hydroxysteroid dehydrogenase-like protein 2 n=1 Tax=Anthonomus grandis grandis TaxID=2921223 RepID=UPI00216685EE|nr:hydroxysteroid dehydrogenase-like protein 2 [Anthonomus grandis grandis]
MINTGKLAGQTIFITGASRGIGKAIALKAAKDGANIVIAAKTATAHPKLPGTIYTAAEEIEKAGGKSLPCVVDIRDEAQVKSAVEEAVKKFGGIDIVVNNASAISLTGTAETDMKKFDLMHSINARGTFLVSKECLPYLKKSKNGHILNLSPPLNMDPQWFKHHVAYTMAKYGMSMCVLGMHEELRPFGIAVNALWPKTAIHTAAMNMLGGDDVARRCRKPEICADAAYAILIKDSKAPSSTGNFFIDEDVLKAEGITDFVQYACDPSNANDLMPDFFVGGGEPLVAAKPAAGAAPLGEVGKLFQAIESNLTPETVSKTQAVFAFVVTGEEAGKWFIDLKTGKGACGQGEPPSAPDATLTMDSKNFFNLFNGKLKPATAYMMGKLKIKGNLQQAMKLEKLMGSLKSKL